MSHYILTASCPDVIGIVAAVTGFLAQNEGCIIESQQFGDQSTGFFFIRIEFTSEYLTFVEWKTLFEAIAVRFSMTWEIQPKSHRTKVLIMASKEGHCLNALLNKHAIGDLSIEIPAIISNHQNMQKMAEFYNIPYYYLPVTSETKNQQEKEIVQLAKSLQIDLIVLARYMQILTADFISYYPAKIINIHHSFLPSFKGARPYHQAYDKGVKLIGATAHYVSESLDEGPIIEQEVTRAHHALSPSALAALGQDIEALTLIKAVRWHINKRVFINGSKTVVLG